MLHSTLTDRCQADIRNLFSSTQQLSVPQCELIEFLVHVLEAPVVAPAVRDEIEGLFDRHTGNYPVVTDAIDFSHFFELAEQYRERERYRAATAVYRAPFEGIDDNHARIDAAYDHYAKALRSALDGYVDCVLAADPSDAEFERYAGTLEAQAMSESPVNDEQFRRALDSLENRR